MESRAEVMGASEDTHIAVGGHIYSSMRTQPQQHEDTHSLMRLCVMTYTKSRVFLIYKYSSMRTRTVSDVKAFQVWRG
jgi:hypothetical protein